MSLHLTIKMYQLHQHHQVNKLPTFLHLSLIYKWSILYNSSSCNNIINIRPYGKKYYIILGPPLEVKSIVFNKWIADINFVIILTFPASM